MAKRQTAGARAHRPNRGHGWDGELGGLPRSFAERTYKDIRFWYDLPAGGHFLAKEEPGLVAADICEFFRPLRRQEAH